MPTICHTIFVILLVTLHAKELPFFTYPDADAKVSIVDCQKSNGLLNQVRPNYDHQNKVTHAVTFALVAHMQDIDLPYMISFISHHISVGVDAFYFLIDSLHEFHHADKFVNSNKLRITGNVKLVLWSRMSNAFDSFGKFQNIPIEEDYTISIDMHDYLVLTDGTESLHQHVGRSICDIYPIPLSTLADDSLQAHGAATVMLGTNDFLEKLDVTEKWIARTQVVLKPAIEKPVISSFSKIVRVWSSEVGFRLVHLKCRSFFDVLMKFVSSESVHATDTRAGKISPQLMALRKVSQQNFLENSEEIAHGWWIHMLGKIDIWFVAYASSFPNKTPDEVWVGTSLPIDQDLELDILSREIHMAKSSTQRFVRILYGLYSDFTKCLKQTTQKHRKHHGSGTEYSKDRVEDIGAWLRLTGCGGATDNGSVKIHKQSWQAGWGG